MNRGFLVVLPIGLGAGVLASYRMEQDKVERLAFEDAMFAQLVAEEKDREHREKERMQKEVVAATKSKNRFWG